MILHLPKLRQAFALAFLLCGMSCSSTSTNDTQESGGSSGSGSGGDGGGLAGDGGATGGVGGSGGSSGAAGTSGTGGAAGADGGSDCCAASSVPECDCGCPSLLLLGAFEKSADFSPFVFDCPDTSSLGSAGTCGTLELTGSAIQHCARNQAVDQTNAGDLCAFGRIRIKSTHGGSVTLGVDGDSFLIVLEKAITSAWATHKSSCRLPPTYSLDHVFLNVNQGDVATDATASIDFVEVFLAPCSGNEAGCVPDP